MTTTKSETKAKKLLAKHIREWREYRGFTQEVLAERSGIDRRYISRLEKGCSMPGLVTMAKLADAFNVNLISLLPLNIMKALIGKE